MRLPDRASMAWDAVLAAAVAAVSIVGVLSSSKDLATAPLLVVCAAYAALVFVRRRAPVGAVYGFMAGLTATAIAFTLPRDIVAIFFGVLIFAYTAGAQTGGTAARLFLPVMLAPIAAVNLAGHHHGAGDWIFPSLAAVAAFLAGRNGVHRAALAVELHEAALRAEETRAGEARRAVAEERRRIAREMHDVVAHSISVMVVQAAGARRILERDAGRAEQAAELIERTGRETLVEMRRLLGVMHEGAEPAAREPAPTLADLGSLAARGRALGLDVTVHVEGEPRPLATGLDLGAYRVLEHALRDLHRSDPAAKVNVAVHWRDDALELTVTDDRVDGDFDPGAMLAVRERVALYGGDITVNEHGGRALRVRFPLQPEPTDPPTVAA